ncbi:aldose epimerase [Cupriavidus necator]|uniref:Aldose epimerase n=1 Tax=Cupriavidus necator TaxID=106590 RepID=A0A1U9V043_CUPNE|nr:aldose epimerase [Cupriavidus necator]
MSAGAAPASCGVWLAAAPVHTLRSGPLTLRFAPAAGGRIVALESFDAHSGRQRDWLVPMPAQALRDGFDAHAWPKAGCYPLLPFSNRIRNAAFSWGGRDIRLVPHPGQPHAMHGLAHARPWQLDSLASTRAALSLRHVPAGLDWPWPFTATQELELTPEGLSALMTLRNDGNCPMPAGAGFHPFFPRPPGLRVQFSASHLWPADAGSVAIGRRDIAPEEDYRSPRALPPTEWSGYYSGWQREARLLMPDGHGLVMRAGMPLEHLVVYAPAGRDFCCIEPVSHVADAINLHQRGFPDTGFQQIEPGTTLRFAMQLQIA